MKSAGTKLNMNKIIWASKFELSLKNVLSKYNNSEQTVVKKWLHVWTSRCMDRRRNPFYYFSRKAG